MSTASQTDYKDVPPLLNSLTSVDAGDLLIVYDISANTTKKITTAAFLANLSGGNNGITSLAVTTLNGFTGTVNGSTNSTISLSTTVTGILKGNGTSIIAAVPSDFPVLNQNTTGTAANITGVLNASSTPALTGDITKPQGSLITTLPNINSNIGTWNTLTVNAKGQVTSGTNISYLTNIAGLVSSTGTNITVTGNGTSSLPFVINAATGGTGLSSAYTGISDGTNTAAATNGETITFRSANTKLSVVVGSNDATYRDNILFTINEANIDYNNLANKPTSYYIGTTSNSLTRASGAQSLTGVSIDGTAQNITGVLTAASFPALTGDITTTSGSLDTVLKTVNSNVGNFLNANITVDAKGRITAASNGSAGSSGGTVPALSAGSVVFANGSTITENNANFFWDNTNVRLGIGNNAPSQKLHVTGNILASGSINGSNLSGSNTGDETLSTIKTKLGITTLSGSNTGDQTITLTGDITGSGTGSFATVLAPVNSNVGTWNNLTVNAKGLVTAASNVAYLTSVSGTISHGTNITLTGSGTTGDPYVINAATGGSGLSSAYASISDGTNTAAALNGDTIRFRSANNLLSVAVGSDDAIYGDNLLLTVNEANINYNNIANRLSVPTASVVKGNGSILSAATSTDIISTLGYTPYNSTNPSGYTTNTGTVTAISIATANGISGTATATSTPQITLSLGAITPTSVNASGAITASNFPTLPSDATKFLNGTGAWSVPAGSGSSLSTLPILNLQTYTGTDTSIDQKDKIAAWLSDLGSTPNAIGYVPAGVWKTSATQTIPANARLVCTGSFLLTTSGISAFQITASGTVKIELDNFTVDCQNLASSTALKIVPNATFNISLNKPTFRNAAVGLDVLDGAPTHDSEIENLHIVDAHFYNCAIGYRCNTNNNSVLIDQPYFQMGSGGIALDIQYCGKLTINDYLCTTSTTNITNGYATDGSIFLRTTNVFNQITINQGQDENVQYFLVKNGGGYNQGKFTIKNVSGIQSLIQFNAAMTVYSENNYYTHLSGGNYRDASGVTGIVYSDNDYFENRDNVGNKINTQHVASNFVGYSYFASRNDSPYTDSGADYQKRFRHFRYDNLHPNMNGIATSPVFGSTLPSFQVAKQAIHTLEHSDAGRPFLQFREYHPDALNGDKTYGWNFYRNPSTGSLVFEGNQANNNNFQFEGWIQVPALSTLEDSTKVATTAFVKRNIEAITPTTAFTSEVSIRNSSDTQLRIGGSNTNDVYTIGRNGTTGVLEFKGLQTPLNYRGYSFNNRVQVSPGYSSTAIYKVGGTLFEYYMDAACSSAVQTDLYSDAIPANTFYIAGDKLEIYYAGTFATNTNEKTIRLNFAGTRIFLIEPLFTQNGGTWDITAKIIRNGTSTVRAIVKLTTYLSGASSNYSQLQFTDLSGITFSNDNTIVLQATSDSAGDITARLGSIEFKPTKN